LCCLRVRISHPIPSLEKCLVLQSTLCLLHCICVCVYVSVGRYEKPAFTRLPPRPPARPPSVSSRMHTLDKTDNQEPASQPARQKYESYTQVRLRTRSPTRSARHPHSLPSHTCGTNRRQMHGAINGRSACLPACLSVWCLVYLALPPTHLHLHAFTLAPLPTLARPATQPLRSVRGSRGESQDFTVYTEGHGLDTQTDRQVDRQADRRTTARKARQEGRRGDG